MQVDERLTLPEFEKDLSALAGMKISRVWLGIGDALFLECGRLKREALPRPRRDGTKTTLKGEVTFMLDCEWRVENRYSVAYGRDDSSTIISHRTRKLQGTRIVSVEASGRVPELLIALQTRQVIRTFQSYEGPPNWFIGFNDLTLIGVKPEWKANDVSVWLCFEKKAYRRHYCFDETVFKPRKFLKEYGL